ncbi:double C2-like [Homalodisca vitripennis]|nr:double C2-like [Homalodisca vitripennis]
MEVKLEDITEFKDWWPAFYKKTCLSNDSYGKDVPKDKKRNFAISKYHQLRFTSENPTEATCCTVIDGIVEDTFTLRNTITDMTLPDKKAYISKVPINDAGHKKKQWHTSQKTKWISGTKLFRSQSQPLEMLEN